MVTTGDLAVQDQKEEDVLEEASVVLEEAVLVVAGSVGPAGSNLWKNIDILNTFVHSKILEVDELF